MYSYRQTFFESAFDQIDNKGLTDTYNLYNDFVGNLI